MDTQKKEKYLKYSPGLFADRRKEMDFIRKIVEEWAVGRPPGRAIRFTGPKGSGKSWLLCEIGRQLREEGRHSIVIRHLILGEDRSCEEPFYLPSSQIQSEPNSWNDFTSRILRYLAEPLGISGLPAPIDDCSESLVKQYQKSGRHLVLLVDGVDELPIEFARDYLERYVLGPFLSKAGTLVVLGGRLPKSLESWNSLALRSAEERILSPFDVDAAKEQFENLAEEAEKREELEKFKGPLSVPVEEVVRRGGGYPQANLLLAKNLCAGMGWKEALQETADFYLQALSPSIQTALQSLCILAGFNMEEMAELLRESIRDCRSLLNELLDRRLVRWESGEKDVEMKPGEKLQVGREYVMDEAVRRVLEETLRENDPVRWKDLHHAAFNLYDQWTERYPGNTHWKQRRDYHDRRLSSLPGSGPGEVCRQKSDANADQADDAKAKEEKRWPRNIPSPMPVSG